MAKFSQLARGNKARKVVQLPFGEGTIPVALVPLDFINEATVIERAVAFARAHGNQDPKEKDPLYERGLMLHTVLVTAMDADVTGREEPFFAGEAEAMGLDPERIAHLYFLQRDFQSDVAPTPKGLTGVEFVKHVLYLAKADVEGAADVPFDSLPPVTRRNFTRALARLYFEHLQLKSLSGSAPVADSASTETSRPPTGDPATTLSSRPSPKKGEPDEGLLAALDPEERAALEAVIQDAAAGEAE